MQDEDWMAQALDLAKKAAQEDEVPVGAILVHKGTLIGQGWNRPIATHDPTAHAEIQAIRDASVHLRNYRLLKTTLYVTLEPCVMCIGAILHARIERLIFGAHDPKAGAVESVFQLPDSGCFNHKILWKSGVMAGPCGQILSEFFRQKRENQRLVKVAAERV